VKTIRRVFLILFFFSTLGALLLFVFSSSLLAMSAPVTQEPGIVPTASTDDPGSVEPSPQHTRDINFTALVGSVITSITSLIGFITTTVITWRREKREASLADMQRQKLETELEKSRLELEELKKIKGRKNSKK
jgi:hypothetical protein